ncbi:MAG: ABC transporter ATP-binding protein [Defluviitaleaceae bacterium]|nr:ABC transporter ATP-binding protein [Defluviitaleaceae bacterium]
MTQPLLQVSDLKTSFFSDRGEVKAVNGISFSLEAGRTIGIVGESGSGKSITSLSIMQLLHGTSGQIMSGEILFKGRDLLKLKESEMRKIRGNEISMIFQEPMTSLNPTMKIGEQIAEAIRIHQQASRKMAWDKAVDMLDKVGIPSPKKRASQFPFELSGGMRQRVMIAMALASNPELLIADEPTTALDVTIQAQILKLIKALQSETQTAMIMITHDLGVIAETCDDVAVMYCGKIVEYTDVVTLFKNPLHPYTKGLLASLPTHDVKKEKLEIIEGHVPSPYELPSGCAFAPRCPYVTDACAKEMPPLIEGSVRCIHAQAIAQGLHRKTMQAKGGA